MNPLSAVSKRYLALVAEADRKANSAYTMGAMSSRNSYFWDARGFAKQLGLSDIELEGVVSFLSKRGLLYWHMKSTTMATVELSDKGFHWEKHEYLFDPEEEGPAVVNNITITNNSGIINLQSTLTAVTQSISHADSLDSEAKTRLTALFEEFTKQLESAPPDKVEAAEVAAEQAKELAEELAKPKPRQSVLQIKGAGLIEAAKAVAAVVPIALTTAKQIVEFISAAA
jgi:predicted transcriptional regulator